MLPWVESPVILIHSHVDLLIEAGIAVALAVSEEEAEEVDGVEVVDDLVEQEEEPPVQDHENANALKNENRY